MSRKKGRRSKPFKLNLSSDTINSILAIIFIALGGLVAISFSRQGPVLSKVNLVGSQLFGWPFILMPFVIVSGGLLLTKIKWIIATPAVFLGSLISLIALSGLTKAGDVGLQLYLSLSALITNAGAILFFLSGFFIGLLILFETSLEDMTSGISSLFSLINKTTNQIKKTTHNLPLTPPNLQPGFKIGGMTETKPIISGDNHKLEVKQESNDLEIPKNNPIPGATSTIWHAPPMSLLSDQKLGKADRGDVKANAQIIQNTLGSFGITAVVKEVNQGPAVTQYALEINQGTKLSKIAALQSDLALALAAPQGQIRIETPIPGRNLVGIEVPNRSLEFVSLRDMLTSKVMKENQSKTLVSLGLDVSGQPAVADLAKMPHILIAGATGSGKSVLINAIIASILFRASPSEVKFIMVDPKRVELTGYNGIPHLRTPVITDVGKVVNALAWSCAEMDRRYKLFEEVHVRNIAAYNELSGFQAMPYIIIVIDEMADVMLSPDAAEVERNIIRLAQMARAVGIHLVLATQRPSVNILTGLIKANVPSRIAFQVSSMIDSRVIIDSPGAEKLLGRGDMLYIPPDQAKPKRIQGAFVSDKEINELINYLRQFEAEDEPSEDVVKVPAGKNSAISPTGEPMGDIDDLFKEAIQVCLETNKASASLLQRRLSVGYARAARILDQLEQFGVITPAIGNKPREIVPDKAQSFLGGESNPPIF